jgi:hypothetical protein
MKISYSEYLIFYNKNYYNIIINILIKADSISNLVKTEK